MTWYIVAYCIVAVLLGTSGICSYLLEEDEDNIALGAKMFFLCPVWPILILLWVIKGMPKLISGSRAMWGKAWK